MNLGELSGCELLARQVLQIHTATRQNPKAPDFKGTRILVMSSLDCSGGMPTDDFACWTAEEQKNYAFAIKQQKALRRGGGEEPLQGRRQKEKGGKGESG